jgi:hypothetical protein
MQYVVAALGAAVLLAGCGAQEGAVTPPSEVSPELERIRDQSDGPVYWLGSSFEGLPLTESGGPQTESTSSISTTREPGAPQRPPAPRRGPFFVYGECNGEGEGDSFRCTGPQIQLQHWPIASPSRYPEHFSCTRTVIRGVPAAQFTDLEIYIGRSLVRIFAPSAAQARRAAAALRPLGREGAASEPLPPPAIDVNQALKRCALDSLDAKLEELRADARVPLLWVGRSFEARPLFRAEGDGRTASFMYGGCKTPEVSGSCYPALTIEVTSVVERRPARWRAVRQGSMRCDRLVIRGAPVASLPSAGEIVVFTGSIAVLLRGPDPELLRRAAHALHRFDGSATRAALPPPSEWLSDELRRVCG